MRSHFDESEFRAALSELAGNAQLKPTAAEAARAGSKRRARQRQGLAVIVAAAVIVLIVTAPSLLRSHKTQPGVPTSSPQSSDSTGGVAPPPDCAPTAIYPATPSPAGPTSELVPAKPAAARVCRYAGFGETYPSTHLAAARLLPAATASRLAAALDAGTRIDPSAPPASCPDDRGAADFITFTYESRKSLTVVASLEGCQFASNGVIQVQTTTVARSLLADVAGVPTSNNTSASPAAS